MMRRAVVATLAAILFGASCAWAAVPRICTYQGFLSGAAGSPVRDSSYSLTFKIYSAASGGASLWSETQSSVPTSKGVFGIALGSVVPLGLSFDVPYYLGVSIGGGSELTPRSVLSSTPYSNTSRDLEMPWSKFQGYSGTLGVIANTLAGGGGALSLEASSPSLSTPVLTVINTTATGGYGLHSVVHVSGSNPAAGLYSEVVGSGGTSTAGFVGVAPANYGVDGESTTGGGALGNSTSGAGVVGITGTGAVSNSSAGATGTNASSGSGGYGVYASHAGSGNAVFATAAAGASIWASTSGTTFNLHAIHGEMSSSAAGNGSSGVQGENFSTAASSFAVEGYHHNSGYGVSGITDGPGTGVEGRANGAGGIAIWGSGQNGAAAGFFFGNVSVTGNLTVNGAVSKAFGTFKIDHPLDPENKYLYHSFVESPDMKNVYDGIITTDDSGEGMVALPGYFEALNQDFSYLLTAIGQPSNAWISSEIEGNSFHIKTDKPRVKLSWQVTGVRHDAAARAHPIRVEVAKPRNLRGTYIDPVAFGLPDSLGEGYQARLRMTRGAADGGR